MKTKEEIIQRIELLTKKRAEYAQMIVNYPDMAEQIAYEISSMTDSIITLQWVLGSEWGY